MVLGGYGGTPSGDPKERLRATEWLHSFQRRDDAWDPCVAGRSVWLFTCHLHSAAQQYYQSCRETRDGGRRDVFVSGTPALPLTNTV